MAMAAAVSFAIVFMTSSSEDSVRHPRFQTAGEPGWLGLRALGARHACREAGEGQDTPNQMPPSCVSRAKRGQAAGTGRAQDRSI